MLALATSRTTVRLVEASTGRELATLTPPELHDIKDIVFNAQDSQLAIAGGAIQLWDLRIIREKLASMKLDWDLPKRQTAQEGKRYF